MPSTKGRNMSYSKIVDEITPHDVSLRIVPGRVLKVLLLTIGVLVVLGAVLPSHTLWLGRESYVLGLLAERVHLDLEGNIPSWFSALQLLACSVALGVMAISSCRARSRWRFHWVGLAIGFLYLSLDEAAQLHELLNVLARMWGAERSDGTVWVIPALLISIPVGLGYIPFLLSLPIKIAALKILAGILFVSGAIGIETIPTDLDQDSFAHLSLILLEETLEMVAITLYLFVLLRMLETERRSLRVTIGS